MIKGFVFDFDGLILDTETPSYTSWNSIFAEYDETLPLAVWLLSVGTAINTFDPVDYLEKQKKQQLDRPAILARQAEMEKEMILKQPIMPGVELFISEAKKMGYSLGVASSSPRAWVGGHLSRLGLIDQFETIVTQEDVVKTKPFPYLFEKAVKNLNLFPYQVIAFEDSGLGITAAKAAGIFTIAIPNQLTKNIKLDHADLVIESMANLHPHILMDMISLQTE